MSDSPNAKPLTLPDVDNLPLLPRMDREQIARDIKHPKAAAAMSSIFAQEGPSAIQAGDPAPDFELPRLGGPDAGERVRLSDHFAPDGKGRPVALVFGSYT